MANNYAKHSTTFPVHMLPPEKTPPDDNFVKHLFGLKQFLERDAPELDVDEVTSTMLELWNRGIRSDDLCEDTVSLVRFRTKTAFHQLPTDLAAEEPGEPISEPSTPQGPQGSTTISKK